MKAFESLEQLERMCHLPALAGHEEAMIEFMKQEMLKHLSDVHVDRLGNVIGVKPGTDPSGPKVMVFAHMDEVGFMVRKIDADGFVRITRVGGIPEKSLPAQRVVLQGINGPVTGVIGPKSHHLTPAEEKFKVVPINDLFVDIGAHSREDAQRMGVQVGTPITYTGFFEEMPGGQIAGKALDDRAGCFVILQVLRLLAKKEIAASVYFVGSVQEEFNIRGVVTAGYAVNPDMAIGVDIGLSCDTPDLKEHSDIHFGGGAVVGHYTFHGRGTLNGLIPNPKLRKFITVTAEKNRIPIQHSVFLGGLGDTSYLAVIREGVPCVDVGFPARYTHSPIEVGCGSDMENLIQLLAAALESIDSKLDLSR